MKLPEILDTKDGSLFRTQQVRVRYESGIFHIERYGPEMTFAEMRKKRKPAEPEEVRGNLYGQGHIFANLGVSCDLTTTLYTDGKGKHYLMLVRQERPDMDRDGTHWVAKYFSGYLDLEGLSNPERSLKTELEEELIIIGRDGKLLRGSYMGEQLATPYTKPPANMEYRTDPRYQIFSCEQHPHPTPEQEKEKVIISGREITGRTPKVLIHAPTNSANLVYSGHLDIPAIPQIGVNLVHAEIPFLVARACSNMHVEEKFNLATKLLEVKLVPRGIFFMGLDNLGKLDGSVKTFSSGELVDWTEGVTLSEAFTMPSHQNILTRSNISLEEFLKTQE